MHPAMKILTNVFALCLVASSLVGCGEALCGRAESSYASITKRVKDCAPSGSKYFSFSIDKTRCDVTIKACNESDRALLTSAMDCTDKLPACTADTYANFTSAITACSADPTKISTACTGAFAGFLTTKEETK